MFVPASLGPDTLRPGCRPRFLKLLARAEVERASLRSLAITEAATPARADGRNRGTRKRSVAWGPTTIEVSCRRRIVGVDCDNKMEVIGIL